MVTAMLSREKAKGHFSVAKIGKQRPEKVCMCVNSSRAPGREALGKKHQMGELVVSVQPEGQWVQREDPQIWSRGFKWPHPAKGPEIWGRH